MTIVLVLAIPPDTKTIPGGGGECTIVGGAPLPWAAKSDGGGAVVTGGGGEIVPSK